MRSDKPFRRINELVSALANVSRELGSGTLHQEGLEAACDDARELFERLVVLRHKARETAAGATTSPRPATGAPDTPLATPTPAEPLPEPATLRLDTRPAPEPASRQTSLIEAIEHTEQQKAPIGDGSAKTPSLGEKLGKAAVSDLGKAISLSHKFWFVAELFNGDRIAYEKGIEKLNTCTDITEAMAYVRQEVMAKLTKPADPEALATFNELVQRRYA